MDKYGDLPLTFEQFEKLAKGSEWKVVVSGLGAIKEVKGLEKTKGSAKPKTLAVKSVTPTKTGK